MPASVTVAPGEVLTVTADAGSYGTVFQELPPHGQWTVSAKSPLNLGPGRYRIETVIGSIRHSVDSRAVAALNATLPRATELIRSQAIITKAIVEGRPMLSDKFKRLAERSKAVPEALAQRADRAFERLDAAETRAINGLDRIEKSVTDAEDAAAVVEDAANQLTNGG